jgi:sorting nexin-1/2
MAVSNTQHQHPPRPEDAAVFITVSDPVQLTEGMNKYTSYRVDVRGNDVIPNNNYHTTSILEATDNNIFQNSGCSAVLRRYSDFLWLYERLHKERPGSIVPPLPDKQAVARFTPAFVEERRKSLERFLRRVAVHPELYDAPSLDTFLRADDITFQAAKNAKGHALSHDAMSMSLAYPPSSSSSSTYQNSSTVLTSSSFTPGLPAPPKKDGLKKWFAETKTSISGDLVRSPDDDLFLEIDIYIDALEKQMKTVQQQASSLVKKGKEIASGLYEFGLAFNILGQSEADALGGALSKMGSTASDDLSSLTAEHSSKEVEQFEEPLKDYLKTIHAVKLALQKRHDKRLTYTTCLSEVATKRATLAKLRATPGAEAKAYGAELSLKRGEAAAEAAKEDFATVSQRVLREVDRFKREKADDMRRTVLDYITLQIDYNRKMEQMWSELLPHLESIQQPFDNHSAMNTSSDTRVAVHCNSNDENTMTNTTSNSNGAYDHNQGDLMDYRSDVIYDVQNGPGANHSIGYTNGIQYRDVDTLLFTADGM